MGEALPERAQKQFKLLECENVLEAQVWDGHGALLLTAAPLNRELAPGLFNG